MFWNRLLRQRREKKKGEEEFRKFAAEQESFYGGMGEAPEAPTDSMAVRRLVVTDCEQMLDISREIEDARVEYEQVTKDLNDLNQIQELSGSGRKKVMEIATNVVNLRKSKDDFYKTDHKISDSQFTIMQQAEPEISTIMKRFETNEAYLDTINRDLHYLEGEKMEWDIVRQECIREQTFLRRASVVLLIAFVAAIAAIFGVGQYFRLNVQLEFMAALFIAALFGAVILIRFQDDAREIRRCEVNRNYAITLENKVKIKYVNTKNAVDYTCAKYQVQNSKEMAYIYEAYLSYLKEQDRLRQMNEDMTYYENQLLLLLEKFQVQDADSWVSNADALLDEKKQEEMKKALLLRRRKLRNRIEYNLDAIKKLRQSVEANLGGLDPEDQEQIQKVVDKIRKVNQDLV